jgi:hypothetical protein
VSLKMPILSKVFFVCLSSLSLLSAQESQSIQGLVVDPAGGMIPGAKVEVFNDQNRCKTTSDSVGKFRCDLSAGRYKIVLSSEGFFPYRRAAVNLEPASEKFVKVRPAISMGGIALTVGQDGVLRDVPLDPGNPPQYQDQLLDNGLDVVVRYDHEEKRGLQIEFSGLHLNLTAETLDISAEKILCSDPIRTCTASGSVVAQIGRSEFRDTQLIVDLSTRNVVLSGEPNISRTF